MAIPCAVILWVIGLLMCFGLYARFGDADMSSVKVAVIVFVIVACFITGIRILATKK